MLLMQAGQIAVAAPMAAEEMGKERKGEQNAAAILKAIPGMDPAKVDTILQDQDARAVLEHITSLSPKQAEAAAKRMSARSVQMAEEAKQTSEWMNAAIATKGLQPRFVPPTADAFVPQRDNTSVYVHPDSNIRITRNANAGELEIMDQETGRTAYVTGGTGEEQMQRAVNIANTFDVEAQGRDLVNNKKREMLGKLLESKGVEGRYVIVDSEADLLRQE